jgi:integrase
MAKELTFKIVRKKYIYASYYASDGRLEISTGLTLTDGKETKNTTQKKERIRYLVRTYVGQCEKSDTPVLKRDLTNIILGDIDKVRKVRSDKLQDVLKRYLDKINAGEILNDGSPYSPSAKRQLSAIHTALTKSGFGAIAINQFTATDFAAFTRYLINRPLSQNSVSNYTGVLMGFLKRSYKMKWHENKIYLESEDLTVTKEDIDTHVYLSVEEIEKIRNLKVDNPLKREARDLIVFGCYTGLRFSDLVEVGGATANSDIIAITLKKTKRTVHIPMGKVVKEIWQKYGGNMPTRSDSRNLSYRIQEFCREAKIDQPTLYTNTIGGKKISKWYKKWELTGTHTMRRSFATNAFKAGVPAISIMKITGHRTQTSFMQYIRISGEENAELMLKHDFFN